MKTKAIETVSALLEAQLEMAGSTAAPLPVVTVPLAQVCGRVLAQPVQPSEHWQAALPAGTLLDATHIPLLAADKRVTAQVYGQMRAGIITLVDDEPGAERTFESARIAGITLAAAAARAGAQTFEATCRRSDERLFARTVQMYAGKCSLSLVAGTISPLLQAAVEAEFGGDGGEDGCGELQAPDLQPFGALQRWHCGRSLIVALPGDAASALAMFTVFVTPLMRRLAGRHDIATATHAAWLKVLPKGDEDTPLAGAVIWVREQRSTRGPCLCVVPTAREHDAYAFHGATGLAWRAQNDHLQPDVVVYVPLGSVGH